MKRTTHRGPSAPATVPEYDPDKNVPRCPLCGVELTADNWRVAAIRYGGPGSWTNVNICRDPACWRNRAKLTDDYTSVVREEGGDNYRRWHYAEAVA